MALITIRERPSSSSHMRSIPLTNITAISVLADADVDDVDDAVDDVDGAVVLLEGLLLLEVWEGQKRQRSLRLCCGGRGEALRLARALRKRIAAARAVGVAPIGNVNDTDVDRVVDADRVVSDVAIAAVAAAVAAVAVVVVGVSQRDSAVSEL